MCLSGQYPPIHKLGGLFFAVWTIYLFDRVYDSCRCSEIESKPARHTFAGRHRKLLIVLMLTAIAAGLFSVLPHFNSGLAKLAAFPALMSLIYFCVFRFLKREKQKSSRRGRFPAKELVIGWCFASGVMITAVDQFTAVSGILFETALTCLFAGNCLLISRAERNFDREADGAAYFGSASAAGWMPAAFLTAAAVIGLVSMVLNLFPPLGFAILAAAGLEFLVHKKGSPGLVQPLADGALLFPWILLLLFGI